MVGLNRNQRISSRAARHEAGHCAVCWAIQKACGLRRPLFERVIVRTPDEVRNGPYVNDKTGNMLAGTGVLVMHPRSRNRYPSDWGDQRAVCRWRKSMMIDAIITCAGPAAEAKHSRKGFETVFLSENGGSDLQRLHRLAYDFAGLTGDENKFIMVSINAARHLICQESIWKAVSALSDGLQTRHVLEAEEVIKIIDPILRRAEVLPILKDWDQYATPPF